MFHRTQNLLLRPAWPEDAHSLFAAINDWDIVRQLASAPWPYTLDDANAFISRAPIPSSPQFILWLPNTGLVGSAGIGMDDETGQLQLGYWIARPYRGRGFATEATCALVDIARGLRHPRITASHFIDNPASGRVLTKAGFAPSGIVRPGYSRARGCSAPTVHYELSLREGVRPKSRIPLAA